eukprot:Skav211349  [mRNA]  locus=scaffold2448:58925:64111:- [translate_table: standard]
MPLLCDCGHETRIRQVKVCFTPEQWEAITGSDGSVVLMGARVTEQAKVLDLTGSNCAVLRFRKTISTSEVEEIIFGEMFCGGYGGWSHAIDALCKDTKVMTCQWAIDRDPICCSTYNKNHPKNVHGVDAKQCWAQIKIMEDRSYAPSMLFQAGIEDAWWVTFASRVPVEVVNFSAPCPPWSAADASAGLSRQDGRMLIQAILLLGKMRPRVWIFENVGTLKSHKHFPVVMAAIAWTKFRVKMNKVFDLSDHVPQHRERLLLIAENGWDDELTMHTPVNWPTMDKPTFLSFHAIMKLDSKWTFQSRLSDAELAMYLDPANLPKTLGTGHAKKSKRDVSKYRLRTEDGSAACVMTSYGLPLSVDPALVKRGGLYSSLLHQGNDIRKHATPELVILFGTPSQCWLPSDEHIATAMLGNSISPVHALIAILNASAIIRPLWYGDRIQAEFVSVISRKIDASNIRISEDEGGIWFFREQNENLIDPTQMMRDIDELTIQSPLQSIQICVEQGILLREMLMTIQGCSSPPFFEIVVRDKAGIKLQVTDTMAMPACPLKLKTLVPSCFIPQESSVCEHDWPFVLILAPSVTVVVKRSANMRPQDVEQIMQSQLAGHIVDGNCFDMFGKPCNITRQLYNVVLFLPEQGLPATQGSKHFKMHPNFGTFIGLFHRDHEQDLNNFMLLSGMDRLIQALGWELVTRLRQDPYGDHVEHKLIRLQIAPGRLALQPMHFAEEMRTLLFTNFLNCSRSFGRDVQYIQIKLWNTWIWQGWVERHRPVSFIMEAWEQASEFVGEHIPIRIIHQGKMLSNEFTINDYCDNLGADDPMKLHAVLQLKGGGPDIQLLPAKRDVRDANMSESGQAPDTVGNPTYENMPSKPPVCDEVESTVDRLLRRLMNLPLPDKSFDASLLEGLTLINEDVQMTMNGSIADVIRVMEAFHRVGLEQIMHEMGWQMVLRFPSYEPGVRIQMVVLPIPGAPTHFLTSVLGFIVTALTFVLMPVPHVPDEPGTRDQDFVHVKVKLWSTWVVDAAFPPDTKVGIFNKPWFIASTFIDDPTRMRMISTGKQLSDELPIDAYARKDHHGKMHLNIHLVLQLHGGGPPGVQPKPKIDGLVRTKNDLIRLFMDVGCDIKQSVPVTEKLLKNAGLPTLNAILRRKDHSERLTGLTTLAAALAIELPDFNEAALRRQQSNQKRLDKGNKATPSISASQYDLKKGHFMNQDDTPCEILTSIQHACSGVYLCDVATAMPWIEKPTDVSRDELAIVVLGGCPKASDGACKLQCVPAFAPDGSPVVLSACVHNIGGKPVKVSNLVGAQVPVSDTVVMAMTTYQDEVDEQTWEALVSHPARQLSDMLTNAGVTPQFMGAPWGRSWRGEHGKTTPQKSTSLQMHCRVPVAQRDKLMKVSGLSGVYLSPKTEDGSIDTQFAVIWMDQNLTQMKVTISTLPAALGMIRISNKQSAKTSRGIRIAAAHYEDAHKQLKPSIAVPKHVQINHVAKLEPTPVGAGQEELRGWLESVSLRAKPIKPLGHKAWMLGFEAKPDSQWYMWNENMMLLTFFPKKPAQPSTPILAGSRKPTAANGGVGNDGMVLEEDAWATYREKQGMSNRPVGGNASVASSASGSATPAVRVTQGPIEDRFTQQDARMDELAAAIGSMKQDMVSHVQEQKEHQKKLDEKVVTFQTSVTEQIQTMATSFEQSLQSAMKRQDRQLSDLKALMKKQTTPKKKAKKGDGMEDTEDKDL